MFTNSINRMWICMFVAMGVVMAMPGFADCDEKIPVFASILPQKHFIEKIAGDKVAVSVMVTPDTNPATFDPSQSQMEKLNQARAYFTIGVPFESWLEKVTRDNPNLLYVHTDEGVGKLPFSSHEHIGPAPVLEQNRTDPHIWLDPVLVKTIANNICRGLVRIDPENKGHYEKNLETFLRDVDELDQEIKAVINSIPESGRKFMAIHPSWDYFAKRYGLTQYHLDMADKNPGPKQLEQIIYAARKEDIPVMFVQPCIKKKNIRLIVDKTGMTVISISPQSTDWRGNLLKAARSFVPRTR